MINISDEDIDCIEKEMGLIFNTERRNVLKSFDDVQACPGSGKTTVIAAKLIMLAKKWPHQYRGICVLSHTRVAKNEIINRLEQHAAGRSLLKYPHFIGTFQDFVNRFLAFVYCRSNQIPINQIDDDVCKDIILNKVKPGTKYYLDQKRADYGQLQYIFKDGVLDLQVPGGLTNKSTATYQDLEHVKSQLKANGCHFYNEMYEFGKAALSSESGLIEAVRYRFPVIFLDEMQDTNKLQDELINQIFSTSMCCLQRFGDPDQSIYDGMSCQPNETYNQKILPVISTTHRFSPDIARLTSGLSFNGLELQSMKNENIEQIPNTIFLVDETTRHIVIPKFSSLCANYISVNNPFPIKAIGAIGKKNTEGLNLCHYFPSFDKSKNMNNFKPNKLIHYFSYDGLKNSFHNSIFYSRALDGITKCTRLAEKKIDHFNIKDHGYTKEMVKRWLNFSGKRSEFNSFILEIQSKTTVNEREWSELCEKLLRLLEIIPTLKNIQEFISFEKTCGHEIESELPTNTYVSKDQFDVEIGTIHSVKGETHAATLILETKYQRLYDIHSSLNYLLKEKKDPPQGYRLQLMKQLYVAMTRPRDLLCLALDKSRFTEKNKHRALELGWNIIEL